MGGAILAVTLVLPTWLGYATKSRWSVVLPAALALIAGASLLSQPEAPRYGGDVDPIRIYLTVGLMSSLIGALTCLAAVWFARRAQKRRSDADPA